jgi:type IV pilus assembly protein PilV
MKTFTHSQQGVFLIEALIGILVFSLGVLAMVALGTAAVSAQSDAQYRTEAANLANEIASQVALRADRIPRNTPADELAALTASLTPFNHNLGGATCNFTELASGEDLVSAWVLKVAAALPNVIVRGLQIDTATFAAFGGVSVTVCWQGPTDKSARWHTLVTYVN